MRSFVHFIPIATSVFALWFAVVLLRRYMDRRSGPHLLWWGIGALFYVGYRFNIATGRRVEAVPQRRAA